MPEDKNSPSGRQDAPHNQGSNVVGSPAADGPRREWTREEMERAIPERPPQPTRRRELEPAAPTETWPVTFMPPFIGEPPYDAMCKVFYRRNGAPYVASAWIVEGQGGRRGILTAGHVVYQDGVWSQDYFVCRQYSRGAYAEAFLGVRGVTLQGWIHGQGAREFWDIGAIVPERAVGATTPAIQAAFDYDPRQAPFNFFADAGYPAKPANGFPFDGEYLWVSQGPLIAVHGTGGQPVLEACNAMEQGSSGSPWLVWDAVAGRCLAAGVQSSGWDGVPSSYSPYFDRRNLIPVLREIGLWGAGDPQVKAAA